MKYRIEKGSVVYLRPDIANPHVEGRFVTEKTVVFDEVDFYKRPRADTGYIFRLPDNDHHFQGLFVIDKFVTVIKE